MLSQFFFSFNTFEAFKRWQMRWLTELNIIRKIELNKLIFKFNILEVFKKNHRFSPSF